MKQLVLIIFMALAGVSGFAQDTSGTCGEHLTWVLADGTLTISGTGRMTDYAINNASPWPRYGLTTVVVEPGVESLGAFAFYYCSSLVSVTLPESLTVIENRAFNNCSSLVSVTLPESLTAIEDGAFQNCTSLESIIIPESVTVIKGYVFYRCSSLASIIFPESLTIIGNYSFAYCASLVSITLPASLTTIVVAAFRNCTSLTSITLPEAVTTIEIVAFAGCGNLTEIMVAPNNPAYSSEDGVLFDKNKEALVLYLEGKVGNSYTIPSSVNHIRDYAFYHCEYLASITLPEAVDRIGYYAFSGCSNLTSITLPKAVTTIESPAFSGCSSLTEITVAPNNPAYSSEDGVLFDKNKETLVQYPGGKVGNSYTLPSSVTSIEWGAFVVCTSLASITLPESLTTIGGQAFYGCESLASITLPEAVTTIGNYAFNGCSSLKDVTVNWTIPLEIDREVFNVFDINLHVPHGTKAMYEAANVWKEFTIAERPPVGIPTLPQAGGWKAYVDNGVLRVSGLAAGEVVSVYDASGKRVYQGVAAAVPLAVRGVYIIRAENRSVRVAAGR